MNKLPTGEVTAGAKIGGGSSGNDQENRDSIDRASSKNGITLERKRPRYSICCLTVNGPNLNGVPGVHSFVGRNSMAPNYDHNEAATADGFFHGTGQYIDFQHEFREPAVFLGGQLFVGKDATITPSTTSVTITKRSAADVGTGVTTHETTTIDSRTINNRLTTEDYTDVLYDIPGGRAFFAAGERIQIYVTPDTDSGTHDTFTGINLSSLGLQAVSMILWFKTLHV